jgi:hypothetical protein
MCDHHPPNHPIRPIRPHARAHTDAQTHAGAHTDAQTHAGAHTDTQTRARLPARPRRSLIPASTRLARPAPAPVDAFTKGLRQTLAAGIRSSSPIRLIEPALVEVGSGPHARVQARF